MMGGLSKDDTISRVLHVPSFRKMPKLASIEIGSHTARLLISQKTEGQEMIRPLVRKRAYIRLAEGSLTGVGCNISKEAVDRTLKAVEEFLWAADRFDAQVILGVSTGVTRDAVNAKEFLDVIQTGTGLGIRVLSGVEEAQITGMGVLHALGRPDGPYVIFDQGGGTTEFLFGGGEAPWAVSLPLGASILTQKFLHSDPPEQEALVELARSIDREIHGALEVYESTEGATSFLVGTGGTVTTLAAMIHGIGIEEISPGTLNGVKLEINAILTLFHQLQKMTSKRRQALKGMDRDRADVILGGTAVVIRILEFFRRPEMIVSVSDLLEGVLIEYLEENASHPERG